MDVAGGNATVPLVLVIVLAILMRIWRYKRSKLPASVGAAPSDGPILASAGLMGARDLQSLAKGTMAGFEYNLLTNDSGRVMYYVQLGHNSWSHIIAYGDKSVVAGMGALAASGQLEPVTLEGNFPDHFHMVCNPGAQTTVREVFTPDVMANFIDFCRSYDFELYHDMLYVSRAQNAIDRGDITSLTTDVADFLQRNVTELKRL